MTINYYLMREQVSLMRAKAARTIEARIAHEGLAKAYALRLREIAFPISVAAKIKAT
jgi:hypothetical protein